MPATPYQYKHGIYNEMNVSAAGGDLSLAFRETLDNMQHYIYS
jgi:hypothetical protein